MQTDAKLGHLLMILLIVAALMPVVISAARRDHHLLCLVHVVSAARSRYVLLLPVGREDAALIHDHVVQALPRLAQSKGYPREVPHVLRHL